MFTFFKILCIFAHNKYKVMSKFKFENQKDFILESYVQGKTCAEIARLLNSSNINNDAQCIRKLLRWEGVSVDAHPNCVITDDVKKQIDELLHQGKTPKQISDILNLKTPTVSSYIQKLGLKFRPNPGNIHYFEMIDSYAKAYILGFIAADGALVPAKHSPTITLTITVKYEDRAILEFIKSEIGNTHKLLEIRRLSSFDNSKMIHHARLAFSTPQIVHDIMKYGITPRKSFTLPNIIPNIPEQYRDAFIIGLFDADGSIHIQEKGLRSSGYICEDYSMYINIRGTNAILEGVCEHLGIARSHIHQHDSIPSLSFANKKDTYRLFQCYKHLPFYYKRKHDKFLQRVNHPSYDKYKQVQTISSPTE